MLARGQDRRGPGHPGRPLRERHRRRRRGAAPPRHRRERLGPVGQPHGRLPQPGIHRGQQRRDPAGARVGRPAGIRPAPQRRHDRRAARPGLAGRVHGRPPQGRSRRQPPPLAERRGPGLAIPLPGDRDRAGQRPAAGPRHEAAVAMEHPVPQVGPPLPGQLGRRRQHDPPPVDARPDRPARRGPLHLLRRLGHLPAAARAGWETWYVPESRIVHLEGASTGIATGRVQRRRPRYWFQARRRYWLKNHGAAYTALVDAAYILGLAAWRLRRRIHASPTSTRRSSSAIPSGTASSAPASRSPWPRTRRYARRRCIPRGPRDPPDPRPHRSDIKKSRPRSPRRNPTEPTLPTSPTGARHLRGAKTPGTTPRCDP